MQSLIYACAGFAQYILVPKVYQSQKNSLRMTRKNGAPIYSRKEGNRLWLG